MPVTSNELAIHVIEPNEKQNKERLAYMECSKYSFAWQINKDKIFELYQEYFEKYNNSKNYYKYDLMYSMSIYHFPPIDTTIVYTKEELIEKTKDSYFAYHTIPLSYYIYEDLKSDKRKFIPWIEGYERIAKQYPNTQ